MKVIWVRYVTDKERLSNAMRAYFQAAYLLETHGQNRLGEQTRSTIFPKSFNDAGLFISEYEEAFKQCTEERPINRALQIFRLRMNIQNSSLIKEILKPFNIAQLRRESPRFIFNEKEAIESVFVWKVAKQFSTISFAIEQQLDGGFEFTQLCDDGPINKLFLQNTSLQEETVSLISSFQQSLQLRGSQAFAQWEDIEQNFNKLRLALVACIKDIFFKPVVEVTCQRTGQKHFYLKLHPRIFLGLMFAFKQKWLYEESVAGTENPNFRLMEKLLVDWVRIYNKTDHVYYLKETNGAFEPVMLDQNSKCQVINRILEAFTSSSIDLRMVLSRQYSQWIQQSELISLFEAEMLDFANIERVNPFLNNFMMVICSMINQEPALVNRYLKCEKPEKKAPEESKQMVSTFEEIIDQAQQQTGQLDVAMVVQEAPQQQLPESDWDEEALLPRILSRYKQSMPYDKETQNKVVLLLSCISVTQQGKSLINSVGRSLLQQVFSLQVDNRIADPAQPLDVKFEYIVGLPHTLSQQRISPDHLSQLLDRVPALKKALKEIVNNVVSLAKAQAKEVLESHFTEIKALVGEERDQERLHKYAGKKVKDSKAYYSLMMKTAFLNSLSQQQMHFDYAIRQNPHNDVMAELISTPDDINQLLDLLELISMKESKTINKFIDLLKIVFAEQEFSIEKLKFLFTRAKRACKRLQEFVGVPLSQVKGIDELLQQRPVSQESILPVTVELTRRQQFECLISVIDFYALLFQNIGQRAARKVGTHEKWDDVLETLMWSQTLLMSKSNELLLNALKGNPSAVLNLADTSYYKAIQENIEKRQSEPVLLDEGHADFLEDCLCVKGEIDHHIQQKFCLFSKRLEDCKMFMVILLTANQTMANPERQNSVNEVIRCNLKAFARVAAKMIQSITLNINLDCPDTLLTEVRRNDSLLTYLLKILTDQKIVKGTFLCQFVASDGLIALCKVYNDVKDLYIRLGDVRPNYQARKTLYIAHRFVLTSLVKLNQMLTPFIKLNKDNQAYQNPAQHMAADTEPRKYQDIPHMFANHYNQMMNILLGFPEPKALANIFQELIKVPEHAKTSIFMLFKELSTGFSTIPAIGPAERNDRDAERDFFQRIMADNLQNMENLDRFENVLLAGFQNNRRQPRENRDPTSEEIETVTVMGYSPQEADAALRMANFDISQAIELLLTNIEEVVAYSERHQKSKEEELRRKEQEEIEAAMEKSLGLEESKMQQDDIKTITHEEFQKITKEYKQAAFATILSLANIDNLNPTPQQQMTQVFASKLIETSDKEQRKKLAEAIFDRAKAMFDATDMKIAGSKAILMLEFDLKMALVAVRDFNIKCKNVSCEFAVTVATAARHRLIDLVGQYKDYKPNISMEALKSLDQEDKDRLAEEYSVRSIMLIALQLILHFIVVEFSKTLVALRKAGKDQSEKRLSLKQILHSKQAEKFERRIQPNLVFDMIKLLLDHKLPHLSKAELDLTLMIAIKLFSFPLPSKQDIMNQKESALMTLQLALKNQTYQNEKILRSLLSISVFDSDMSNELSGQMIKKLLFASAIHRFQQQPKNWLKEIKAVESELTKFKISNFIDETKDFYSVNPSDIVYEEEFQTALVKYCQVADQNEGNCKVQLKQPILDEIFAQERRQIPEFERLLIGAKQGEKHQQLINKAYDAVFTKGKGISRKAVKAALNTAFDKLAYLDKITTFDSQKQQLCSFTTAEEMEAFISELIANQQTVVDLLEKAAKFTQVYRSLMPKKAQAFSQKLLDNLHPLLWDVEKQRDNPTQFRFRITPKMVETRYAFMQRFLNALAGFSRLMSHEEQIIRYDLRTKILQQAVAQFTAVVAYLINPSSGEFNSEHQARTKAITMLMVINCLIENIDETIYISRGCYRSSLVTLLSRSKTKFIHQIATVVKLQTKKQPKSAVNEIVHQIDTKMECPDDQESSFCSISESLQEANILDDKDAQLEGFQQENEQLQGILVAQAIDCLTSICTFIETEKQNIADARKQKAKLKEGRKPEEEVKQDPVQQEQIAPQLQDSEMADENADGERRPSDFLDSLEFSENPLNPLRDQQYIEDEYDAEQEESEESGDEDEDDDDDENLDDDDSDEDDDNSDHDSQEDIWVRRQQRRRQAEAAQDIINAPNQETWQHDNGMHMPIEDVGLQPRYIGRSQRETQISENWSVEERQVQRTLALLRGIRPGNTNTRIMPRNPLARSYFHPHGAFPGERDEERPENQSNRSSKPAKLSELMSVFQPLESQDILAFIMQSNSWLSAQRKKFVKAKDTSSSDGTIFRLLREPRDPRSLFFARSRSALIEQLDSRLLDAELGFGRPFSFVGSFGQREEHENLLQRYERMLSERARLMNLNEILPSERFGDNAPMRMDTEVEPLGQARLLESYRTLLVPHGRNEHLSQLQQRVLREAEQVQAPQQEQQQPTFNAAIRVDNLQDISANQQLQQQSVSSPSLVQNQPRLLQGIQLPELNLNLQARSSSPRLIQLVQSSEIRAIEEQKQETSSHASRESGRSSQILIQQPAEATSQQNAVMEDLNVQQQEAAQEEDGEAQDNVLMEEVNQPVAMELVEQEPMTCGIPNSVLLAHDIDPVILVDLPEDIQASVLSEINWQPPAQQQPAQQPANQLGQQEEAKQQPSLEDQFGIDPGFLANLPPEMRQELLQNESLRNQNLGNPQQNAVQREAEAMDVASIIQTAATPQLRAEMLANLDEATIATLPENLRIEANAAQAAIRQRRNREGLEFERFFQQVQQRAQNHLPRDFGRGRGPARGRPGREPRDAPENRGAPRGGRFQQIMDQFMRNGDNAQRAEGLFAEVPQFKLEQALERFCAEDTVKIFEEPVSIEPHLILIESQIVNEDLIVEGVLQLLLSNASTALDNGDKPQEGAEKATACKLIQFVQQMTTMKSQKGEMRLTNKFINAITLLLKLEINQNSAFRHQLENKEAATVDQVMTESNEVEIITTERIQTVPKAKYSSEQMTVILTLIGVIRLVAKNKHFVSHMLKSLIYREDYFAKKGMSLLQRQADFIKAQSLEMQPLLADLLDCLENIRITSKQVSLDLQSFEGDAEQRKVLVERLAQLKTLSHNFQLAALDTFIEFGQSLVEAGNNKEGQKSWKISKHAIKSLLQMLELQIVDQDPLLLSQLSSTLIALFSKSRESWELILDQCQSKTSEVLGDVNADLLKVELELIRGHKIFAQSNSGTPTKAILEERKDDLGELLLSRQSSQFSELVRTESIQQENAIHIKLDATQEAMLRNILLDQKEKISGLKHIFQLFNIIYKEILAKSSESDTKQAEKAPKTDEVQTKNEKEQNEKILAQIRDFYQCREMQEHMRLANLALQTLAASSIDLVDLMAANLSCIFGAYMPDLHHMVDDAQRSRKRHQTNTEEKITIKPLQFVVQKSKVLSLFKNVDVVSDRLKEFASLCLKNKKAINQYLQLKTKAEFSINDIVNYMPNILSFENKRAYFKKEIQKIQRSDEHDDVSLNIRRSQIFMDTYANLNYRKGDIKGKFRIRFDGEEGIDAGGVARDFYIELSRQMFNPDYSLFKLCSNGVSHYVAPNSFINPDHLQYLAFAGRMIGKALFDGHYMDCYFAKPLYKMILGEDLTFGDLEDLDNEFYKGLKWMVDEDVDNASLVFAVDREFFGKHEEIDLIPNGRNIAVTNENKLKYIEHRVHFFLYGMVREQIDAFLTGFHQLIPKDLIRIFNYKELELLISGLPNFDLADLKKYTQLDHYTMNDPQIVWFWEVLQAMDQSEIGLFLQFVTGCSKIPLEGFKNLQGMRGVQHFSIKRVRIREDDVMRLPQGHTCFNSLDLPEYPTKELLQERLLFAIKETNAFGMA